MEPRQALQGKWLQAYLLVASLLILLLSIGNFLLFSKSGSITGMPIETVLILGGVFLAVPAGLLNIGLGFSGLKKERAFRALAITGLLAGALGLVTGLIWWGALIYLLAGGFR